MFNLRIIACLIAFFAMLTIFMSGNVTGDNENQPQQHTHHYENVYGVCISVPPIGYSTFKEEGCITGTLCLAGLAIISKACTHGILVPGPERHPDPCGCAATNCGYSSCGCEWGEGNNGQSECPCETTCS